MTLQLIIIAGYSAGTNSAYYSTIHLSVTCVSNYVMNVYDYLLVPHGQK